jgi:uncharacterized protein
MTAATNSLQRICRADSKLIGGRRILKTRAAYGGKMEEYETATQPRSLAELWQLCEAVAPLKNSYIHGVHHWRRVEEFGLMLARETGASELVVRLFAALHDCQRCSDHNDPGHGHRAAAFARDLFSQPAVAQAMGIEPEAAEKLFYALQHHNDGMTSDDATVGTCWDADRLDLPRVGVKPAARLMSTQAGKRRCADDFCYRLDS